MANTRSPNHHNKPSNFRCQARGIALVTTLIVILMLSLLAAALFRNSTTQIRNAGGTADHQRSLRIAEDALRYGEWLLIQPVQPSIVPVCNTIIDMDASGVLPVMCNNALPNPASSQWTVGMTYTPAGMNVHAGGRIFAVGTDIDYAHKPMLYIQILGSDPNTRGNTLYQLTAIGYGGLMDTVSVVQSVVSVGAS